jgi:hypothetical protein
MPTLEEELRMDEEDNRREAEFIRTQLPAEVKAHFSDSDLLYFIDAIVDYYYESGILESSDDEVEIDLQQVAEALTRQAKTDHQGTFDADEVFFVVQADLDYQEQRL